MCPKLRGISSGPGLHEADSSLNRHRQVPEVVAQALMLA